MLKPLKRIAAKLPLSWQNDLRQRWYRWKIKRGRFTHDEPEYHRLQEWIAPGDLVIDVGANIGVFTAAMSRLAGPDGHVFAFEPVAATFRMLAANCAMLPWPNATLMNVAVSNASGLLTMELPTTDTGLPDIYQARIVNGSQGQRVLAIDLDAIDFGRRISLIKIDVEGHELQALQGMERLLRKDRPRLIVEDNDSDNVVDFLKQLEYRDLKAADSPNRVFEPVPTHCA